MAYKSILGKLINDDPYDENYLYSYKKYASMDI